VAVSTEGGASPAWSQTSRELVFLGLDRRIMAVSYRVDGESFRAGRPRVWSETRMATRTRQFSFALHPDGTRAAGAVTAQQGEERHDTVVFVLRFFDELRRLAPAP
jgi:hypothetical protein